jgi:hypothetical protein
MLVINELKLVPALSGFRRVTLVPLLPDGAVLVEAGAGAAAGAGETVLLPETDD